MATTAKNFVLETASNPIAMIAAAAGFARNIVANAAGVIVDTVTIDMSADNYAKHGGVYLTLSGTTPVTIDLTALGSNTVYAGDTSFATWNQIVFYNNGAQDLTVAPAGSNGARLQLNGTSPTITVAAGSYVTLQSVAGLAVDSTHKGITVTPTSGGTIAICVAGA